MLVYQRVTKKYCRRKHPCRSPCTCCVHLHHIAPLARLPHAKTKALTCEGRRFQEINDFIGILYQESGTLIWDWIRMWPQNGDVPLQARACFYFPKRGVYARRTGDSRHIHNFCRTFTSEIGAFTPKNRDTSKMDLFSINWDWNQLRTMFFDLVCVVTRVKLGSCGWGDFSHWDSSNKNGHETSTKTGTKQRQRRMVWQVAIKT